MPLHSPLQAIGKDNDDSDSRGDVTAADRTVDCRCHCPWGAVKPVGAEDKEELEAEGQAIAANMLDRLETRGKVVTPGNIAFYTLQALKSGRRSGYAGRMDAMSPAASLDRAVQVRSMDEAIGVDPDDASDVTLHDLLAGPGEDTDAAAARHLDWDAVLDRLDDRRQAVVTAMAAGYGTNEIAGQLQVSPPRICQVKESLTKYVVDTWGDDGLADTTTPSKWRAGLRAGAERRAGRAERAWRP